MKPRFASAIAAGACMLAVLCAPCAAAPVAPQQPAPRSGPPSLPGAGTFGSDVPIAAAMRWNVAQLRQSFDLADHDHNGELSRAESQQLIILPRTFEDLDVNHDGVLSRAEYESILSR